MLCVRIDGREVDVTPVSLARLVFTGKVDRYSPSRIPGGTAERPLEQSMGLPHGEALTTELLECLRRMYSPDAAAIDIQELRLHVEDLCQWRWESPHIAARFAWTAAWLNELTGHVENAIRFYDAFLQMPCGENHLRLLAWNNRGVLRIRLGRLEGVHDLMRAAIPCEDQDIDSPPPAGVPAACFNLLNLINACLGVEPLTQVLDKELAEYFYSFSSDRRAFWLGQGAGGDDESRGQTSPRADGADVHLWILRDPTFRRLNSLTTRLAAHARPLAGGDRPPGLDRPLSAISQLALWNSCAGRADLNGEIGQHSTPFATDSNYERYAEATSLLLREDIPSTLTKLETPLTRAEQLAQEELADIESRLALNRRELLRPRLQVQRAILCSLNRQGRVSGLIARVDAQLERIAELEAQREQSELQKAYGRLVSEVERFCTIIDLHRADRESAELDNKLQRLRTQLAAAAGDDMGILLDELSVRVQRHARRLKRLEIRRTIRGPFRHLRRNWPTDRRTLVPESVYRALAQCRVNDPESLVRDWTSLQGELEAHQGRYHLDRALSAMQSDRVSWDGMRSDLAEALHLDPDLWLAMAPLFGLSGGIASGDHSEMSPGMRVSAGPAVKCLFDAASQPEDTHRSPAQRAAEVLEEALRRIEGEKWLRLWRHVEATLSAVVAVGGAEAISQARALAETCLDCWPTGWPELPGPADPRNPVNLLLESCDKARCLAEAEQSLNARPPRYMEAQERFVQAVEAGIDTRDQLRRAVMGLYLAGFHEEDKAEVRRRVLNGLETWIQVVPEETRQQLRSPDVVTAIERVREAVRAERSAPDTDRIPPDGSMSRATGHASVGRTPGESEPEAGGSDTGKEGILPEI